MLARFKVLIHFLGWFIGGTILLYILAENMWFGVIAVFAIIAVEYVVMHVKRYLPLSIIGFVLAILLNYYII